jgi:hypothetical protein
MMLGYNYRVETKRLQIGQWLIIAVFLLVISVPYLMGWLAGDEKVAFGGFLLNPLDGNSYLAKMYQGWRGDLLFRLPYTADPGEGTVYFVFYLILGHLARIFNLSTLLIFHTARLLASFLLAVVIAKYVNFLFSENRQRNLALITSLFGLGLGWVALLFGKLTSDLWVAEGFPFLASYANPHFPLGLSLMLLILWPEEKITKKYFCKLGFFVFCLAWIMPFGIVIIVTIFLTQFGIAARGGLKSDRFNKVLYQLLVIGLFSGPVILYEYIIAITNPVLRGWNAQNLTASPGIGDFLISFSPFIIMAFGTIWKDYRDTLKPTHLFIIWMLASILLMYLPFGLQRRMISGLFLPISILAFWLVKDIFHSSHYKSWFSLVWFFSLPTTLIVIILGIAGILQKSEKIFVWRDELSTFEWIKTNTDPNSVILGSPHTGLLIPAYTGRRVLYGHPYETVNAAQMEALVIELFDSAEFGRISGVPSEVDYIFIGPREQMLKEDIGILNYKIVYQNDGVTLYQLPH